MSVPNKKKLIEIHVAGYDAFQTKIKELEKDKTVIQPIIVIIEGTMEANSDKSWCLDCNTFLKTWNEAKATKNPSGTVIYVPVTKELWLGKSNPYPFDPKLKVTNLPTIMRWGTEKKLYGPISNVATLMLLFE